MFPGYRLPAGVTTEMGLGHPLCVGAAAARPNRNGTQLSGMPVGQNHQDGGTADVDSLRTQYGSRVGQPQPGETGGATGRILEFTEHGPLSHQRMDLRTGQRYGGQGIRRICSTAGCG